MKIELNAQVDKYLTDGCMRCKFGGTPQCKVNSWREELETLRQIVLETGLIEEIKWGVPVYTYKGKNVVTVAALKESATIGFFKGVLLSDTHKILSQQGKVQSGRIVKFTTANEIKKLSEILKAYIIEAISIEASDKQVTIRKNPEPLPEELLQAFKENPEFKRAFYALTPGRQIGYIIYFSQPRQAHTRLARIEKCKQQIFNEVGLRDSFRR